MKKGNAFFNLINLLKLLHTGNKCEFRIVS